MRSVIAISIYCLLVYTGVVNTITTSLIHFEIGYPLNVMTLIFGTQTTQTSEDFLKMKLTEINTMYKEQRYPAAQKALEEILAHPHIKNFPEALPALYYNLACVHALQGQKVEALVNLRKAVELGYSDYLHFAEDTDFTSVRTDAEFQAYQEALRQRFGPKPLVYDSSAPAITFPLTFETRHSARHRQLREEFNLDAVVAGAKNDYERLQRLTFWTSRQWEHDSTHMASKNDPIIILREARQGGRFICTNYAVVLAGAANAYGISTRLVNLLPKDVETRSESHTVVEAWLPQFKKWVLADGQFGLIAEKDGIPLNAVELQAAIAEGKQLTLRGTTDSNWKSFIFPNLYFFKISQDQRSFESQPSAQLVLVPKGSQLPRIFAGGHPEVFARATYTSNASNFYVAPE
ncbi:MAG: transglutaminase domain-containing protein [Acidobacteriota bacterium]